MEPNGKNDLIETQLRAIAPVVNLCRSNPEAEFKYDMMSDSLIWTDELPPPEKVRFSQSTMLRVLQQYRTSIILGSPNAELERYWNLGKELFPNWAGFDSARVVENSELVEYYKKARPNSFRRVE